MYYAEEIIDGVLHFKSTPNGQWIQMTPAHLTNKILQLRAELERAKKEIDELGNELNLID